MIIDIFKKMDNKSYVGIIILNYNNWEDTINCIESIEKFNSADIKYYIVDNGSTNKDAVPQLDDYLKKKFEEEYSGLIPEHNLTYKRTKTHFIISTTNDGYAKGNNKALEFAYKDEDVKYILILNNDVLFVEDIIPTLETMREQIKDCAFVSPILYKKDGKKYDYNCARTNITNWNILISYLFWYKDVFGYITNYSNKNKILKSSPHYLTHDKVTIELPSGSCMFSSKELWRELGGFDSNTFLYYEENILFKKIHKMGLNNYLLPGIKCIHVGAQSSKKMDNWFTLNEQFKSSIYYLEEYGDLNFFQRIILIICKKWFPLKIQLLKKSL